MKRVSFVIPMLNEIESIDRCIQSILEQSYPLENIEINVVDGLSKDGSRQKVKDLSQKYPQIKLFDNPMRRTPQALNIGIRNATGDVVIILGAHTRIHPDFIALNIGYMQEKAVKCTGGTQINVGNTLLQEAIGIAMGSKFGMPTAPYRFLNHAAFVDTVVYAAYDRSLFDEIGYFDEELHISEDAELNWRIRKAGYKIFYSPDIKSFYYPRKTLKRLSKQFFNYGILRVNVIKKHPDAVKATHLIPPLFIALSLASLLLGVLKAYFWVLLATIWVIYLLYLLLASVITSIRYKKPVLIILLPAIYATMQLSWGIGFIIGIFKTHK